MRQTPSPDFYIPSRLSSDLTEDYT